MNGPNLVQDSLLNHDILYMDVKDLLKAPGNSLKAPGNSSHIQATSFWAFLALLVPGIFKFVIDLIQDMAYCTYPNHLNC